MADNQYGRQQNGTINASGKRCKAAGAAAIYGISAFLGVLVPTAGAAIMFHYLKDDTQCNCPNKPTSSWVEDVNPTQPAVTEPVVEDNTQDGNNVIIKPQPGPSTDIQQPNEPIVTEPAEPTVTEPIATEPTVTEPTTTEPPMTDPFAGVGVKPQDSPDLGQTP